MKRREIKKYLTIKIIQLEVKRGIQTRIPHKMSVLGIWENGNDIY